MPLKHVGVEHIHAQKKKAQRHQHPGREPGNEVQAQPEGEIEEQHEAGGVEGEQHERHPPRQTDGRRAGGRSGPARGKPLFLPGINQGWVEVCQVEKSSSENDYMRSDMYIARTCSAMRLAVKSSS